MTYYVLITSSGRSNMWFFRKKKQSTVHEDQMDAEVKEAKDELFKAIDKATSNTDKVSKQMKLMQKKDITLNIFLATGGDRRK